MKRTIVAAMLCLILAAGCTILALQPPMAQYSPAVRLNAGGRFAGSGVVVAEKDGWYHVATCKHVILSRPLGTPWTVDGHPAELGGLHSDADAALLRFRVGTPRYRVAELADAEVDQDVTAVVFTPLQGRIRRLRQPGRITAVADDWLYASTGAVPGNSGGGVYTADGRCVGLISGMPVIAGQVWESAVQVVPAAKVRELLGKYVR